MKTSEQVFTGIGIGLCIGFAGAITVGAWADKAAQRASPEQSPIAGTINTSASPSVSGSRETNVTRAVAEVAPAVVSITTEQPAVDIFGRPYQRNAESSEGSGVVIDEDGIVLTNAHVVSTAVKIQVTFADGTHGEAQIVGLAEDLDLAVLRIPVRPGLEAVTLGTSADLILGEPVIAIGNPFGLGHTVTTGVVSATARALETDERVLQDFIQTDASINPGNSGGPLLNSNGHLIGINTAIQPDSQGIGFAIPIDRAIKVAKDLVESGMVRVPWLGVVVTDIAFRTAEGRTTGPEVTAVLTEDPTTKGLAPGDIIISIDGRSVQGRADLNAFLSAYSPGDSLNLTVYRQQQAVELKLLTAVVDRQAAEQRTSRAVGWTLGDKNIAGTDIVTVERIGPEGSAARVGLRRHDLILGVDGRRVQSPQDVQSAIQAALGRHRSAILITVRRGRNQGRVSLPL